MCDAVALMQALKLGYTFDVEDTGHRRTWWFRLEGSVMGPFDSIDGAVYAALSEHEMREHWEKTDA